MLILGTSPDDTGTQLERITRDILEDLGYQNLTTNRIGPGGEEVDVTADYQIPLPGGIQTRRLIAECKAYRSTVDTTDWLKFLGKVFVEEATQNQEVYGLFVALSGVNGNVAGNYDLIHPLRPRITLLSGDNLSRIVCNLHHASSARAIIALLGQLTARTYTSVEIVYYQQTVYWLVSFDNEEFTLLSATGGIVPAQGLQVVLPLVRNRTANTTFIDLQAEARAIERQMLLQKQILVSLMEAEDSLNSAELETLNEGFQNEEIVRATTALSGRGFVALQNGGFSVVQPDGINRAAIGDLILFVLRGAAPAQAIERFMVSDYLNRVLDNAFVDHISITQAGLPFPAEERATLLQLIRLSPSALAHALTPDELVVTHRVTQPEIAGENFDLQDRQTFLRRSVDHLIRDFSSAHFKHYFYGLRELREIETVRTVAVKSAHQIVLQRNIQQRLGLGQLTQAHGGGTYTYWSSKMHLSLGNLEALGCRLLHLLQFKTPMSQSPKAPPTAKRFTLAKATPISRSAFVHLAKIT
jgi:hypothetical protein